jgi:hypothetical protein
MSLGQLTPALDEPLENGLKTRLQSDLSLPGRSRARHLAESGPDMGRPQDRSTGHSRRPDKQAKGLDQRMRTPVAHRVVPHSSRERLGDVKKG